jgi:hypothetical protein
VDEQVEGGVAIGVPGEDVGTVSDAGVVETYGGPRSGKSVVGCGYTPGPLSGRQYGAVIG